MRSRRFQRDDCQGGVLTEYALVLSFLLILLLGSIGYINAALLKSGQGNSELRGPCGGILTPDECR